MKYRTRVYYTEAQKTLMWKRWQQGASMKEIAQLFGRHHSTVQGIISRAGGVRPRQRTRPSRSLSLAEREEISRGIAARRSLHRLRCVWVERRQRFPANSLVMADWPVTAPIVPSGPPGIGHPDRRLVNCQAIERWHESWLGSCARGGRRSRLPAGLSGVTRTMRTSGCRTRRSTGRCSFRPAGR